MTHPSNETLAEMIHGVKDSLTTMKEEQLPQMRRETSNGLQMINEKLEINSKRLDEHNKRIVILENYTAVSMGAIAVWKWMVGALVAVIGVIISIFSINK